MALLTELEAAALGCTRRYQPCTAHFVRTRFRVSPSARFSDSAGSVYPLMRRLEKRGLLVSSSEPVGGRSRRCYEITAAGRRALAEWLGPPIDEARAFIVDLLRTRMIFLDLLPPRRRKAWLDEAERVLGLHLATIDSYEAAGTEHDVFFELAHANSRLTTGARLEWVRLARRRLAAEGLLGE